MTRPLNQRGGRDKIEGIMSNKWHLQRLTVDRHGNDVYIDLDKGRDLRHLTDLATAISTWDKTVRVVDGNGNVKWEVKK